MQSIITLTLNPTIDKSTEVDSVASEIKLRCAAPTFDPGGGGTYTGRPLRAAHAPHRILGGHDAAPDGFSALAGIVLVLFYRRSWLNTV